MGQRNSSGNDDRSISSDKDNVKNVISKVPISSTADFFIYNLEERSSFIYEDEFTKEKILFSYKEEEVLSNKFTVRAEILSSPYQSTSITFRSNKNCECKSDMSKYRPSLTFDVFYDKEGFYKMKFTPKDVKFRSIIFELEKRL